MYIVLWYTVKQCLDVCDRGTKKYEELCFFCVLGSLHCVSHNSLGALYKLPWSRVLGMDAWDQSRLMVSVPLHFMLAVSGLLSEAKLTIDVHQWTKFIYTVWHCVSLNWVSFLYVTKEILSTLCVCVCVCVHMSLCMCVWVCMKWDRF